jgi:gliding motility-associated protein GldE
METLGGEMSLGFISTIFAFLESIPLSIYPILIACIFFLICSGFISGSEVAFFSLSPAQLKTCRESSKPSEKNILFLLDDPKLLLACILILNNTVNTAIVTLSTFAMWEIYGKDNNLAVLVLTFGVTTMIVFFGEILPKVFSAQRNLFFAKHTAKIWLILTTILAPFAASLTILGDIIEKKYKKKGYKVTADELNEAVEMTIGHETSEEEREILKGIVNFGSKNVKQIMQGRMDVFAIDLNADFHELMDKINKNAYSRVPIFEGNLDKIIGILYIKDLLPHIDQSESFKWQELIDKDVFFIPESKRIDELLRDFQAKQVHIAIIVDEYGGTSGLITMEDIIEEIVGDINDEFDSEDEQNYKKIDEATYQFDAKTSLNDFCKIVDIELEYFVPAKGDSESLGGLILELFSKFPKQGEEISYKDITFTINSVSKKRIKWVKVFMRHKLNDKPLVEGAAPEETIKENSENQED